MIEVGSKIKVIDESSQFFNRIAVVQRIDNDAMPYYVRFEISEIWSYFAEDEVEECE